MAHIYQHIPHDIMIFSPSWNQVSFPIRYEVLTESKVRLSRNSLILETNYLKGTTQQAHAHCARAESLWW
jgi:hypothetical protein